MASDKSNGSNLLFFAGGLGVFAGALGWYSRGVVGGGRPATIGFALIAIALRKRRRANAKF